jgi:hypothetical protein
MERSEGSMRVFVPIAFALLLWPATAAAGQGKPDPLRDSRDLWATVNVCDTAAQPNVIGIRASMPGMKRTTTMSMRFQVQFLDARDGKWRRIASGADSRWRRVGRGKRRVMESGWSFTFLAPKAGGEHTLRGVVTFRWRRGGRVLRKLQEFTEAGHKSTRGADPPDFSAAVCKIRT